MTFTTLVIPASVSPNPELSIRMNFIETLDACRRMLAWCYVEYYVDMYNNAQYELSFANYLVIEIQGLEGLRDVFMNADGLQAMDVTDVRLGVRMTEVLEELGRLWGQPDLEQVIVTQSDRTETLRFIF